MSIVIEAASRSGDVQKSTLAEGVNRLSATPGTTYRLTGPEGSAIGGRPIAKRVGDDMVIERLADGKSVVLEGFYTVCADGDSCSVAFADDGDIPAAVLLPSSAPLTTLSDGSLLMYPIGGSEAAVASTAAAAAAAGTAAAASGGVLMPTLAALGGLAVAAGGGGGGGSSDGGSANNEPDPPPQPPGPTDTTPPATPTVNGGTTSDTTPTITGTATLGEGETLTVTVNGVTYFVGSNLVLNGTDWSLTIPDADQLPSDTYVVTATVTDAAGNFSSATAELTVNAVVPDTTPPAPPVVDSLVPTNDTTPEITGNAEPNSKVAVYIDGTLVDTVDADGSGNWTFTPNPALTEGTYVVTAKATDAAGNESAESAPVSLEIDTTPPTAPTVDALLTNDTTPTITGTAAVGDTVRVQINGATYQVVADGSGNWSVDTGTAVPVAGVLGAFVNAQTYTATATVTDAAGNIASGSAQVAIDTTPPTAPTVDALLTNDTTPTITGTAAVGDTVRVQINGATYQVVADGSGNWSVDTGTAVPVAGVLGAFVNGQTYTATATVTDAAGNFASDDAQVAIDTTPPSVEINAPVAGDNTVNRSESLSGVTVSGTAEAGSTVTVVWGAVTKEVIATGGTWSAFFVTGELPADGTTTQISATATDAAGNTSDPASRTVTIDTTNPAAPTVTVVGLTNDSTPTLSGTATLGAGESLSVNVGGVDYTLGSGLTIDGSGNWSLTSNFLTDGSYNVIATVIDAAGNTSSDSTTNEVTVDTTPPDYSFDASYSGIYRDHGTGTRKLASGSTTSDDTLSLRIDLNSVLESGDRIEIYRSVDGRAEVKLGEPVEATIGGNQIYQLQQNLSSFGGDDDEESVTFTYRAVVIDEAGNSTTLFSDYRVTVDFDDD